MVSLRKGSKRIFLGMVGGHLMPQAQQSQAPTANLCNSRELRDPASPLAAELAARNELVQSFGEVFAEVQTGLLRKCLAATALPIVTGHELTPCLEVLHHITKGKALLEWHLSTKGPVFNPGASKNLHEPPAFFQLNPFSTH